MSIELHRFPPPEQEQLHVDDYYGLHFDHDYDLRYDDCDDQKNDHDVFDAPDFHYDCDYDVFDYGLDCGYDLFFLNLSHYT